METTKITFQKLKVNESFTTGKSFNSGFHKNVVMYQVYKKTSASKAVCTEQVGYFNTRAVGETFTFSPNKVIEKVN